MARTKDPSAATVKAWKTRKRNAAKAKASASVTARAFGMDKSPAGDFNPTGSFSREGMARLRDFEAEHCDAPAEHALVLDRSGKKILSKVGGENSVMFSPEDVPRLPGTVVTHNHSSGQTFSPDDLLLATVHFLREIRATGPGGVLHRLGSTGVWPMKMLSEISDETSREFRKAQHSVNVGRVSIRAAQAKLPDMLHEVWSRVTKKYAKDGVYYKRVKGTDGKD